LLNYHLAADPLPAAVRGSSPCPGSCWGLKPPLPGGDSPGWGGKGQKEVCVLCPKPQRETPTSPRDPAVGFFPSRRCQAEIQLLE